jgi:nitrate reductase gamma subunit
MDLLDLARGPLMQWSFVIFVAGVLWRLLGIFLLAHKRDLSEPRYGGLAPWLGALRLMIMRSWPRKAFVKNTLFNEIMGYLFHIGLFVVVFFGAFHIVFIKSVTGLSWPALPSSLIYATGVVTIAILIAILVRRLTNPVLRLLSNFDDYFSWFVTIAPLVTGILAVAHLGAPYRTLLGLHILSFELLLIWFPFGKLMHAFLIWPSRAAEGYVFTRRGAST